MTGADAWRQATLERMSGLSLVVLACFCLLSGRLVVLQIMRSEELGKEASRRFQKRDVLPARRGAIVDRNGRLLAANQTVYTVYGDLYHLRDYQFAVSGLAVRDGVRGREIRRSYSREQLLSEYQRYAAQVLAEGLPQKEGELGIKLEQAPLGNVTLARGVEEDLRRELSASLANRGVRGIYFRKETRRFYPDSHSLAHVLGYVDHSGSGQAGVEKALDAALAGKDGYRLSERDSRGREMAAFRTEERLPFHGLRVRLTIDLGLQELLEASLNRAEASLQPASLAVILMNPLNGEILAMGTRPSFDLETRDGHWRNMAIADQYEPGSTFKLVTMAAAMDLGLVVPETPIPLAETGRIGTAGEGPQLSATRVLAVSSNPGIHTVARELGPERLHRAIRTFGFGAPTGIWLAGESEGKVYEPAEWKGTSLSRISMGYQVAVTPLQMVNALSAVANGGSLLRPRIVAAMESAEGDVVYRSEREYLGRVMSSDAARSLMRALSEVTDPGATGERARVPRFRVAGKTGTAIWFDPAAGRYQEGEYVVSFAGVVPAERPQLAGIVVIDRPQVAPEARTGGKAAAPLFAEIVRFAVEYLDLVPGEAS